MSAFLNVRSFPAAAAGLALEGLRPAAGQPLPPSIRGTIWPARRPGERGIPATAAEAATIAISDLVAPADILLDMPADGKRAALTGIADRLARRVGATSEVVLAALLRRERLGSTFIGGGVAVPHARLDGMTHPGAILARLRRPVPFGPPDDTGVDLLLAVLWPDADAKGFVPGIARILRLLRHTELASGLRAARSAAEAHSVIVSHEGSRP